MAPLAEQVEAEVVVRRLVEALGGMRDAAVGYDGACGGVELWRVDVAEAIPRPSLLVEGLHHCSGGLQGTYNGGNTRGVLILMHFVSSSHGRRGQGCDWDSIVISVDGLLAVQLVVAGSTC